MVKPTHLRHNSSRSILYILHICNSHLGRPYNNALNIHKYMLYLIGRFKRGSQRADVDLLQTIKKENTNNDKYTKV